MQEGFLGLLQALLMISTDTDLVLDAFLDIAIPVLLNLPPSPERDVLPLVQPHI